MRATRAGLVLLAAAASTPVAAQFAVGGAGAGGVGHNNQQQPPPPPQMGVIIGSDGMPQLGAVPVGLGGAQQGQGARGGAQHGASTSSIASLAGLGLGIGGAGGGAPGQKLNTGAGLQPPQLQVPTLQVGAGPGPGSGSGAHPAGSGAGGGTGGLNLNHLMGSAGAGSSNGAGGGSAVGNLGGGAGSLGNPGSLAGGGQLNLNGLNTGTAAPQQMGAGGLSGLQQVQGLGQQAQSQQAGVQQAQQHQAELSDDERLVLDLMAIKQNQEQLVSTEPTLSTSYLQSFFSTIIDSSFAPELRTWFAEFGPRQYAAKMGSQAGVAGGKQLTENDQKNPVLWSCQDVVRASYASKELGEFVCRIRVLS